MRQQVVDPGLDHSRFTASSRGDHQEVLFVHDHRARWATVNSFFGLGANTPDRRFCSRLTKASFRETLALSTESGSE